MTFIPALTADQLETLRGTSALAPSYAGTVFLSACPNTNVYTARVNQASFTASFAQITYDGGSGTLADVVAGMTVLISHTNDRTKAFFSGRVRKTPTSTILYINETSADIADNDYIFILDDFRIWDKLGRQDGGVLKHDYDITFRQLLPVIYNLKSAYADWINTGTSVYQIAFAPLALAATSGATISTWAWDVQDGTITVGTSSTQNITATFPAGFRWVYLTVTDSGSRSITRRLPVWAHSDAYPPQMLETGRLQVNNLIENGWDATVTGFSAVANLLDNTLIVAWNGDEIYQDATGSLIGDNIGFVGRIRKATDSARVHELAGIDYERQYTLEGAMTQLARIEQLPYEMLNKTTPTKFGEIKNLTLWRGIVYLLSECSTFLELHSLSFDDTSDTYLAPTRNPVGNILNAVNDLALSINAAMQMNASGSAEVVTDALMMEYDPDATDDRDNLVTVADWTSADILDIVLDRSHVRTVGRLKSSGGAYNSVTNLYTPYESLAPGVAQDYPEGTGQLDRQVLTANSTGAAAEAELNARAGMAFARAQETDQLTVTFPDGYYSALCAARNVWYTFTVSDSEIDITLDSTTRWLLVEVNISYDNELGGREVKGIFTRETFGSPGQTVTYPAVAEVPLLDPVFPPFDPYPSYPIDPSDYGADDLVVVVDTEDQIPTNGNALVTATPDQCLVVVNALLTNTPGTRAVTPADLPGTIRDGKFGAGKDFYLLVSNGATSWVYYTEDIFAGEVVWTQGEAVAGEFVQLDTTATQGAIYILKKADADEWCKDWDFTVDDFIWTFLESGFGQYTASTGFTGQAYGTGGGVSRLNVSFENAFLTSITVTHTASGYTVGQKMVRLQTDSDPEQDHQLSGALNGTNIASTYNQAGFDPFECDSVTLFWDGANSSNMTITAVQICGVGFNPFDGSSSPIATRYSTTFGATFAAEVEIGTDVGTFNGVDTQRIGTAILAAADGKVRKATSGGAYADYGSALPTGAQANALFIPRYVFGSTSSGNTGSNPEYLMACAELDAANNSLYKVTATGATYTDITPVRSGTEGVAVSDRCIAMPWRSGSIILMVAEFVSVRRLCISVNAGSSWVFSGALSSGARSVTLRKGDLYNKQAFITNGTDIGYCADYQVASPLITDKVIGVSDPLLFIEIYG